MNTAKIRQKFGQDYIMNEDTYVMGVHRLLSDAIAKRFEGLRRVLDTNAGAGTTAIALAKYVPSVVSVDIAKDHLTQASENARIANVSKRIEFVCSDVLDFLKKTKYTFDAALLDPDWAAAGEEKTIHVTSLENMQPPGRLLLELVSKYTGNICLRLPKEIDKAALENFPPYELESFTLDGNLKFYCAWFGDLRR